MTDSVKNELAKMYALRAGISQLSIDNDKVNSIKQQQIKDKTEVLNKHKHLNKNINNDKNTISNNQELIIETEEYIEELSRAKKKNKKISKVETNRKLVIAFVVIATILALALVFVLFIFKKVKEPFMVYMGYGIGTAIVLFAITKLTAFITEEYVYYRISKIDKDNETVGYHKWSTDKFDREIKEAKEDIAEAQREINALNDKIQKQSVSLPIYDKQIEKIEENATAFMVPYCAKAATLHDSLVTEFNDFIDERDWESLDLIIFAYETGRVDNIKDALRFIDEERRTNQIVLAVSTATQHICNTINTGFKNLAHAMTSCFDRLSTQIQSNAKKQRELLTSINENINKNLSGINYQIGKAIESIDYNNALMKKQNESSEKMMREIRPFINNANQLVNDVMTGQKRI